MPTSLTSPVGCSLEVSQRLSRLAPGLAALGSSFDCSTVIQQLGCRSVRFCRRHVDSSCV
ncbi:saposin a-type domain-containing protein [Purpureocillium lilacinum]|uniref:Saposin a-type domain-containing protein n=1 Tax=Purpureocillium lilacinum TaxID=33203 RepID=A0A179HAQ7_PURLI|nr:saposin a-type domain-containing protein [Purpureocillium lilacinum]